MQLRRQLPQRRSHDLVDFEHTGHRYTAGLGFFETGGLAEIFINVPGRSGSAIEAVARDAAILTSICLQHGASMETIRGGPVRRTNVIAPRVSHQARRLEMSSAARASTRNSTGCGSQTTIAVRALNTVVPAIAADRTNQLDRKRGWEAE